MSTGHLKTKETAKIWNPFDIRMPLNYDIGSYLVLDGAWKQRLEADDRPGE